MRNVNSIFNKEELIEYMVEVNIFYKRHIDVIVQECGQTLARVRVSQI